MVITVASHKGGVGKSTTAVHLAAYLKEKTPTVLVDSAPNRGRVWLGGQRPTPLFPTNAPRKPHRLPTDGAHKGNLIAASCDGSLPSSIGTAAGRLASRQGSRYPSMMEIQKILAELIGERDQLNEAILSLERLVAGQGKRRGRPPLWLKGATAVPPVATDGPKRRGRPPGSKSKRPT